MFNPIDPRLDKPDVMATSCPALRDHARPSWQQWQLVLCLTLLGITFPPCLAADGYWFFYNLAPGTEFTETSHSRQTGAGEVISEFRERVRFQVVEQPDASETVDSLVSARILSLTNKGRPIDYYDGVTFQAQISVTGETSGIAFSGGQARHGALLQAAGPAKGKDIFWMPAFPTAPVNVGDVFTHTAAASGASGRTEYELEEVEGVLARFSLRYSGASVVGGGSGTESGEGEAVFDMEQGMWRSHALRTDGNVTLPGGLSMSYKSTSSKEISRYRGCDRATTGVDNAEAMIDESRRIMDDMLNNTLTGWPGSGERLHAAYRHFHCPTGPQLSRIGDHLRRAREVVSGANFVCIPAAADPCQRGRFGNFESASDTGAGASRWEVVQLCPRFFTLTEIQQAGVLLASAVKATGVSESHLCYIDDACYYNFMEPAEDVISGNPFAYAYLAREISGWTPPVQPDRVPCFPSLTDQEIRVRGGDAATDPNSLQNTDGPVYPILEDLVTGDRFIRHDNLEGAEHYLHQESLDGMGMRYYLPSGD